MTSVAGHDIDRQALVLLCAPTALGGGSVAAFSPAAWHDFVEVLAERSVSPGELLDMSEAALESDLGLTADQADRVVRLLGRGGPVAIEVERLASRGIWLAALGDEIYPQRLVDTLAGKAPPILFGVGNAGVASQQNLAIVGSRDADDDAIEFTERVAASAVDGELNIISGAARGVDAAAMTSALEHGGSAVGVVADGLEKRIREPQIRIWLADEQLCLLSPHGPTTGFSVGAAMGRNKIIYGLSEFALVVSAMPGRGGTWAGATEALKGKWSTVFVRQVPTSTPGESAHERLLALGARPFPEPTPESMTLELLTKLAEPHSPLPDYRQQTPAEEAAVPAVQATLFGDAEPVVIRRASARDRKKRTKRRAVQP